MSLNILSPDKLDLIGKIIPIFAFLIYTMGFIITNAYFGRLGVFNIEIISTRYISCGITFFSYFLITLYLFINSFKIWFAESKKSFLSKFLELIGFIFVRFGYIFLMIGLISSISESEINTPNIDQSNSLVTKYAET